MKSPLRLVSFLATALLALGLNFSAHAVDAFDAMAVISSTMGTNANRLCMAESTRGDLGCPTYAPYVSTTSGYIGIGTTDPLTALHVSNTGYVRLADTGVISAYRPSNSVGQHIVNIFANDASNTPSRIFNIRGNGYVGINLGGDLNGNLNVAPSTTLHVSGTIRISNGGEACDANRAGAMRYNGTEFQTCFGSGGWATLASAAVSGTIGNQVAFSVHRNGTNQTVSANTWTKISFGTEVFDTNNNFASDRFTPTVPGKYILNASAYCYPGSATACHISIRKNGSIIAYAEQALANGMPNLTTLVDMNGSGDYVELFAYNDAGTTIDGTSSYTYFTGALINARGAAGGGGATTLSGLTDVALSGPASGQVLAYNGSSWVNSSTTGGSAMGDRLISSTMEVLANGATGYVSLSTASSTWGYLGSTASYLPRISTAFASATTISASYVQIPSATTALACSSGVAGTMRYTSGTMQVCNGSSWGNVGIGVPTGTISAFATASCPAGWSEYTAARGRFLRGIDNGAGLDPDGTRSAGATQADTMQGHRHMGGGAADYQSSPGGPTPARLAFAQDGVSLGDPISDGTNGTPRTANETRPKNVAVTYCMYSGYDSSMAVGVAKLASLSDVSVAGAANGQVLAYNGSAWVPSTTTGGAAMGDRITSGTTSIVAQTGGVISITTNGTTANYFDTAGRLISPGISVTTLNGISTTRLYASGPIVAAPLNAGAATTISFAGNNAAYTTAACGAFTFSGMEDGGVYTLAVRGNGTGPASFTHSGLTVKSAATLTCTGAKETIFNFMRLGTTLYVTFVTGF